MSRADVELSQRAAFALAVGQPDIHERNRIVQAIENASSWDDLPPDIRDTLEGWEQQQNTPEGDDAK